MDSKTIQKYKYKSIPKLLELATKHFNLYIRLRDTDENGFGTCISSGNALRVPSANAHAGHYYAAGHYPLLRFNEDNVHLQSKGDNYFKHGNQIEYDKRLAKKIGQERIKELHRIAEISKRGHHKWDRFTLIQIIEDYKTKSKALKSQKQWKS